MSCPDEIAEILLMMIQTGLLHVRSLAWSGQTELCANEADHIHNLPDMISEYTHEKLRFYWDVERLAYLGRASETQRSVWEPLWQGLRPYAEDYGAVIPSR